MSLTASSKQLGERGEAAVIDHVAGLDPVADSVAEHIDAEPAVALWPSDIPMAGIAVVEAGRGVEIKTTIPELSSEERGRFYLRRQQHRRLVDDGACYLFAVTRPHQRDPLSMMLVAATSVDDVISSWIECDGRATYAQVSWSRIFDEDQLAGGRR